MSTMMVADPRIREALNVVFEFALGNLKARGAISELNDDIDALITGINMLGEELEAFIAERLQADDILKESELRFRSVVDNIGMGVSMISQGMEILFMNKTMEQWFTRVDLAACPKCYQAYNDPPRDDICPFCPVMGTLKDGQMHETIREMPTPQGITYFRLISSPLFESDGSIKAALEIVEDVTLKRRMEKELQESYLIAEAGVRARGAFLANISHELTTPLNSIIGFSQILLDGLGGPMNEQQRSYMTAILQGGNRLHETLREIVQFAGLESGEMQLYPERFPIKDLLKSALLAINEKAVVKGVALSLEGGLPPETEIEADWGKFQQVMFSLLDNSVKFTPEGGSVRVSARLSAECGARNAELKEAHYSELITPNSALNGNFIEVSVADTGIGIKEEDLPRLFRSFEQLEAPYTKAYKGTGLGLMLAKKLIELHGGRIWAESEFGKGSEFRFVIPVKHEGRGTINDG